MKFNIRYIVPVVAMLSLFTVKAQNTDNKDFAIKVTADIGLGNALSTDYTLPVVNSESSSNGGTIEFAWRFWKKDRHALEANIGLGYAATTLTADIDRFDYHYDSPATGDMDDVPYIRYYELYGLHQKVNANRLAIPVSLTYRYKINQTFSVHAMFGIKPLINLSANVSETGGRAYSYGIYPQYDYLMIDAPYMNAFGETDLSSARALSPSTNSFSASIIAGIGARAHINGPWSAEITIGYERSVSNMFKTSITDQSLINAENAPVRYLVADGQHITSLFNYLSSSKLSRVSLCLTLAYEF